jgi:hypothetical protein
MTALINRLAVVYGSHPKEMIPRLMDHLSVAERIPKDDPTSLPVVP